MNSLLKEMLMIALAFASVTIIGIALCGMFSVILSIIEGIQIKLTRIKLRKERGCD